MKTIGLVFVWLVLSGCAGPRPQIDGPPYADSPVRAGARNLVIRRVGELSESRKSSVLDWCGRCYPGMPISWDTSAEPCVLLTLCPGYNPDLRWRGYAYQGYGWATVYTDAPFGDADEFGICAAHEVGHLKGLQHATDPFDVMCAPPPYFQSTIFRPSKLAGTPFAAR